MSREEKINEIIRIIDAAGPHGIDDIYIDVTDLEGEDYYGFALGKSYRSGEYGVFTGDFLFAPLEQLSDESIDLIYNKLSIQPE